MRRVILLALLALALPTAALATSIDYEGYADVAHPATLSATVSAGGSFTLTYPELSVNGGTPGAGGVVFSIALGSTSTSCGTGCTQFTITSGSVNVVNGSNVTLFSSALTGGSVDVTNTSVGILAILNNGNTTVATINLSSGIWVGSSETVAAVPEPGTLGMLGTGLLGVAGLVRRKLRS